jgi:hypothetical protein
MRSATCHIVLNYKHLVSCLILVRDAVRTFFGFLFFFLILSVRYASLWSKLWNHDNKITAAEKEKIIKWFFG